MIHPISDEFIGRALAQAERQRDEALIIEMSTPGGLLESTRDIVEKIASGNAAAAGKALHDHVMASREHMHRTHAGASAELARRLAVIPARKSR